MTVKINGLEWTVFFVLREHEKLELEDTQCMGVTYFSDLQIYIDESLSEKLVRQTVIHELAHAFLFSHGIHLECMNSKDTEEAVCDFCGAYLDDIYKFTNKIINNWKKEQ